MTYKIRPHHGMCFSFFQGKGYSSAFTENMQIMKEKLEEDPEVILLCGADDVCACCPGCRSGRCTDTNTGLPSDKAERYDRQVLARCGLSEGARMRWKDFAASVQEHILLPGKREEICGDCQWNALCTKQCRLPRHKTLPTSTPSPSGGQPSLFPHI